MKPYIVSLSLGVLIGVIYALFNVRSPAPPVIALAGLLGILLGEQIPPLIKQTWIKQPVSVSVAEQIRPHVFGHMPKGRCGPAVGDEPPFTGSARDS